MYNKSENIYSRCLKFIREIISPNTLSPLPTASHEIPSHKSLHVLALPVGFGITIAWLWLTFLNGPLIYLTAPSYFNPQFLILLFLLSHSLTYFKIFSICSHKSLQNNKFLLSFMSAVAMTASPYLLTLWPMVFPAGIAHLAAGLTVVAAAVGASVTISFWGWVFSAYTADKISLFYGIAIVIATALLLAGSQLSGTHLFMLAAILPLISLILLRGNLPARDVIPEETGVPTNPIPGKLIALLVLFYTVGGLMHKLVYLSAPTGRELFWMTNIAYSLVTLGAGLCIIIFPALDLRIFYRPVVPLTFAGFVLFPFLLNTGNKLHYILLQSGFALFDLYTWVLFIYLASHHRHPLYVISRGMFFLTFAIFFSDFSATIILSFFALSAAKVKIISFAAASILLLGSFVFQDKAESFAGWTCEKEDTAPCAAEETHAILPPGVPQIPPSLIDAEKPANEQIATYLRQCQLTPREQEIVRYLLSGRNNPYIRNELNISDNTLKTHLRNIYRKTEVADRQQLLDRIHVMLADQA